MVSKVLAYMEKYRMLEEGGTIVAGVSGGADSVCLLFVLLEIRKRLPFHLAVVHVNHGLRQEAAQDAAYVQEICRREQLPFYLVEEDVGAYAKKQGLSLEEAGREVRYRAFYNVLGKEAESGGRIAVAHNSNDRAETMLFHLFRGTGITGLSGILPVNGEIIRPLLCVSRSEIEKWLSHRGIDYCRDATNEGDDYTRNRIRHHILPYAGEAVSRGAVSHMNETAEQLLGAKDYIERQAAAALKRCASKGEDGFELNLPAFEKEDDYLKEWMVLSCLRQMKAAKDVGSVHVKSVCRLFRSEGNGEVHLPSGVTVYKSYEKGMILRKGKPLPDGKGEEVREYRVAKEGEFELPGVGRVSTTVFPYEKSQNIPQKTYTKWLDCDKITKSMVFRTRKRGDFLTVNGGLHHKSLQDYFVNEKVPRKDRDSLYVLAEDSHIIWVPGYRISEYYKVSGATRKILQITINRQDDTGGKGS